MFGWGWLFQPKTHHAKRNSEKCNHCSYHHEANEIKQKCGQSYTETSNGTNITTPTTPTTVATKMAEIALIYEENGEELKTLQTVCMHTACVVCTHAMLRTNQQ